MKGFLNKKIVAILALLLVGVFFLIYWSYGRIDDKFVITVDGYTLGKSKGITVGRDSDIFFDKVSKAYMTLDFTDERMTLKVDNSADTLMYYMVNGANPNRFEIKTDIRVKKYGKEIVISPKTVEEIFGRYSSPGLIDWVTGDRPTQYIMLRHIIALAPDVEEATKKTATSDDMLRSFIYRDGKKFSLCILDKEVQLGEDKYVYSYSFPPVEGIYNLQFFKMAVNSFRKSEPGKTDVTVDSVCYAAKPVLLTTMWGAGHVAFKTNSEKGKLSVDVSFPKGITYVDDLDRLVKCAKRTSDMMTVSQKGNSFPVFNNIYLTAFSNGAVQDFATVDFDLWPSFSKTILLCLMVVGACAGSTGGGLKVARLLLLLKGVRRNIRRMLNARRVEVVRNNGSVVSEQILDNTNAYFAAYVIIIFAIFAIISLDGFSVATNFSAALCTFNNIGPGLEAVGPTCNFSQYSDLSKLVLSWAMLAGRLEIFPMLILFSRGTWKRR